MENLRNGSSGHSVSLMKLDAVLPSKDALIGAIHQVNFAQGRDFRLIQNKDGYYKVNCCAAPPSKFENCPGVCQFLVYAKAEKINKVDTGNWKIYKYCGNHSCRAEESKRKAHDKRTVASMSMSIRDYVPNKKSKGGSIKQVIDLARMTVGLEMKKSQAAAIVQDKRDDSIEKHIGQFLLLDSYILSLNKADPEGTFLLEKQLCAWKQDAYQFKRMYVSFSYARKVWRFSSVKIFVADGTFTTSGMFRQTILLLVTQDGNGNLFLLAYAIVDNENESNWVWFLKLFIQDFPGARLFMSDFDKGVQSHAFQDILANNRIYFARCVKHMIANCEKAIGGKLNPPTHNAIFSLANARTLESYTHCLTALTCLSRPAAIWFDCRKNMFATYIYLETGRHRFGAITNNFAEQYNSVIKDWKTLPILSFCVKLNEYCCDQFFKRSQQAAAWLEDGQELTESVFKDHLLALDVASKRYFTQRPSPFPVYAGQVQHTRHGGPTTSVDVEVDILSRATTCPCNWYSEFKRPCYHSLCLIKKLRLQPSGQEQPGMSGWYDKMYHTAQYACAYSGELPRLGLMGKLQISTTLLMPPESQKQKGRPRVNRYQPRGVPKARCLACGETGHNQTTCAKPNTKIRVENFLAAAIHYARKASNDFSILE